MILEENFLDNSMLEYVLGCTAKEPTLLNNLRHETETSTQVGQMISGPLVGQFLNFMVRMIQPKTIVEVGTFTGYSALYMAMALNPDAKIITCEIDERHANVAKKYFDQSPYGHQIDLRMGPAQDTLDTLEPGIDFAFIDADKKGYPGYYETLITKLKPGGFLVVDNALWGGKVLAPTDLETKAIANLNYTASHDSRVETLMLAIRDGLLVCRKK